MKKTFTIYLLALSLFAVGQDSTGVDSDLVNSAVNIGVAIADANGKDIIPNVHNSVTGGIIVAAVLAVWRYFEKKKLKKKYAK